MKPWGVWIFGIAALVVAGCTPVAPQATQIAGDAGCNRTATREIKLLGDKPDYLIEARAFDGPKGASVPETASQHPCVNATVLFTVRRIENSAFVHGFVTSMNRMDLIEGHAGPAYDGAKVQAYLDAWVQATIATTDAAPAVQSEVTTFGFAPQIYQTLRAQKAPMLCHATGVHEEMCLFLEPHQPFVLQPFFSRQQL